MGRLPVLIVIVSIFLLTIVCPVKSLTDELGNGTVRKLKITGHVACDETYGNVTYYTVKGVVENNCTRNVRSVNVTAVFDLGNRTVTGVTCAALQIIEPRQKTPFEIYLRDSSSCVETYCLTAFGSETDEKPVGKFEIVKCKNYSAEGRYIIVGELKNVGSERARSLSMFCACYNVEDVLITILNTCPQPVTVDPNEKADFEFKLKSGIEPERFELFVSARAYEKVARANWVLLTVLILASVFFIAYMKIRGW